MIIGGGLGGLLSAACLVKAGHSVEIYERLPMIGGRFINLEHKGFQLSSGALHMIPHGPKGPLASMLKEVGAEVNIIASSPMALLRIPENGGFNDMSFHHFSDPLSLLNKLKLTFLTFKSKFDKPKNKNFKQWFYPFINDEWLVKMADSFCGWSLSMTCEDVSVEEMLAIIKNMYRYGGPGVPMGGCSAVIDALESVILSGGGSIHTNCEVDRILIVDGRAVGVEIKGQTVMGDLIISNIGHKITCELYDHPQTDEFREYLEILQKSKPSAGIKISIGADKPLIGHSGVLLTPYTNRINGMNEVTNVDPSLAPPGKHLVMTHQTVRSDDIQYEIHLGLQDIKDLFPGEDYEVLMVQTYRDDWPVNRAGSGSDLGNSTPLKGLYIVGDGAKGKGGIEVEGVALGVANTMAQLNI
ncbi:MAG TPA: NAD(P)/FAD-dependent oxidoreductase [Candidatus Nanoarchaeia archaeon]|nr:NAD(P)/FAD-dependent oxidoreductase [Candidatus Nanoarchaeia archaeon]